MTNTLKFQKGNAKFKHYKFSLPAGHSCPFARACFQKADRETGKLTRGKEMEYACFAANAEAMYPSARLARWNNFDLLRKFRTAEDMTYLILASLPAKLSPVLRIHESGDFFNQAYFDAWLEVARQNPETTFYAYTKALQFWVNRLDVIPSNFKLNASRGGSLDHLIGKYGLKEAVVVYSPEQAADMGLEIEKGEDELAYLQDKSFALLIHGTQAKGSKAANALKALKKRGIKVGYSKK